MGGIAGGMSGATVSPDGTRLAFVATDGAGRVSLWLRPLDANMARPLIDTDFASMPFWSPDGQSIGFFASGRLKSINITTGSVRVITDAAVGRGASWSKDDVIVFSRGNPARLARVSAKGGVVTPILTGTEDEVVKQPVWPHFLPDGRHFLYWSRVTPNGGAGLSITSIEPGFTPRPLVRSDTAGVVILPGILLFARGETLLQQTFDLNRLEVSGDAIPVNEPVFINQGGGIADFSASLHGDLVYQSGTNTLNQFAWLDRTGRQLSTVGIRGKYRASALSPDGTRLAYENAADGDIWILDLARQTSSRLTSNPGVEACPVWFPDNTTIAYRTDAGGVFAKDFRGTTAERRVYNGFVQGPEQITSDGNWLLFFVVPKGAPSQDIAIAPLTADPTLRIIVQSPFPEVEPQISPDGRWLAYASSETGRNEIYVRPFPVTGDERWKISSDGGRQPYWRADSKELFFVADDRRFYAVDIKAIGSHFDYGVPHFLFDMRANVFNVRNSYNVSRDGRRFLINTLADTTGSPLNVVLNWKPQ
jgi:eukaryotic-like serine/threonine-protein kinase